MKKRNIRFNKFKTSKVCVLYAFIKVKYANWKIFLRKINILIVPAAFSFKLLFLLPQISFKY